MKEKRKNVFIRNVSVKALDRFKKQAKIRNKTQGHYFDLLMEIEN